MLLSIQEKPLLQWAGCIRNQLLNTKNNVKDVNRWDVLERKRYYDAGIFLFSLMYCHVTLYRFMPPMTEVECYDRIHSVVLVILKQNPLDFALRAKYTV